MDLFEINEQNSDSESDSDSEHKECEDSDSDSNDEPLLNTFPLDNRVSNDICYICKSYQAPEHNGDTYNQLATDSWVGCDNCNRCKFSKINSKIFIFFSKQTNSNKK